MAERIEQSKPRQLILDTFEPLMTPVERAIPLSQLQGGLPLRSRLGGYVDWVFALMNTPIVERQKPRIFVDPIEKLVFIVTESRGKRIFEGGGRIIYE